MSAFVREAIEFLTKRKQAYVRTFGVPGTEGHVAFTDLGKYCRAFDTSDNLPDTSDLFAMGRAFGRREAFWRVFNHLKLSEVELAAIYKAAVLPTGDE